MIAAQDAERRDVDDERAARLEDAEDFCQRGRFFGLAQTVEDVERRHEIEGRGGEGDARDRRLRDSPLAVAVRELEAAER